MTLPAQGPAPDPSVPPAGGRPRQHRRRHLPSGLRRESAAAFYGVSLATFDRLNAAGAIPAPVRLGRTLVWGRAELQAQLDHGGPPRSEWAGLWREVVRQRRSRG